MKYVLGLWNKRFSGQTMRPLFRMEKTRKRVQLFIFHSTPKESFCTERSGNKYFLDKNKQYLDISKTKNRYHLFLIY